MAAAAVILHKFVLRLSADIPLRQECHCVENAARILVDRAGKCGRALDPLLDPNTLLRVGTNWYGSGWNRLSDWYR